MSANRIQAYQYFQTGDIPTEAQFKFVFGSIWFKDEKFNISDVTGLSAAFENTLSVEQLDNHIKDEIAHTDYLVKKDGSNIDVSVWKALLDIVRVASVDEGSFLGNVFTKEQIQAVVDEINKNIESVREYALDNIISEDNSLLIEPETKNIESNVSIFSQEIENFNSDVAVLSFPAIQILGVYDGGLKLNSNEYQLISPVRLELLAPRKHTLTSEFFPDVIEIQYTHLKTDLI